jgi:hypothetical protein
MNAMSQGALKVFSRPNAARNPPPPPGTPAQVL